MGLPGVRPMTRNTLVNTARLLMLQDRAIPIDIEARLHEQGITLKRIRRTFNINN